MAASKKELSGNNFIIVMVLISLMVLGVSGLIAKALFTSVVRDTKVISAKSKADKQLKADLDAAPKLVDGFNALGSTATILEDALPTSADLPSLIVTLENMGNDAGITLKSVQPAEAAGSLTVAAAPATTHSTGSSAATSSSGAVPEATPQSYNFTIDFGGTYSALQKFFADIETSARPMRVTGVQITGTGSSLSGEMDVETFWQDKAQLPFGTETIK